MSCSNPGFLAQEEIIGRFARMQIHHILADLREREAKAGALRTGEIIGTPDKYMQ